MVDSRSRKGMDGTFRSTNSREGVGPGKEGLAEAEMARVASEAALRAAWAANGRSDPGGPIPMEARPGESKGFGEGQEKESLQNWATGITWVMLEEELDSMPLVKRDMGEEEESIRQIPLNIEKAAAKLGRLRKTAVILQEVESSPSRDRVVGWIRETMVTRRNIGVSQVKALGNREFLLNVPAFLEDQAAEMLAALGPVVFHSLDKNVEVKYANVKGCILMDMGLELPTSIGLRNANEGEKTAAHVPADRQDGVGTEGIPVEVIPREDGKEQGKGPSDDGFTLVTRRSRQSEADRRGKGAAEGNRFGVLSMIQQIVEEPVQMDSMSSRAKGKGRRVKEVEAKIGMQQKVGEAECKEPGKVARSETLNLVMQKNKEVRDGEKKNTEEDMQKDKCNMEVSEEEGESWVEATQDGIQEETSGRGGSGGMEGEDTEDIGGQYQQIQEESAERNPFRSPFTVLDENMSIEAGKEVHFEGGRGQVKTVGRGPKKKKVGGEKSTPSSSRSKGSGKARKIGDGDSLILPRSSGSAEKRRALAEMDTKGCRIAESTNFFMKNENLRESRIAESTNFFMLNENLRERKLRDDGMS
ncbi:hypothetical protein R1sor_009190 [Riccia sorocarpa]|uniref:Uncharacterized protein n=1 Tax=Riccia sorocarpa TaxID=122646 RepID=A0ABD3H6Y8_9MARC